MARPASTAEARAGGLARLSVHLRLPEARGERGEGGDALGLRTRIRRSRFAQGTTSALILGLLLHLRYGYLVGDRDHHVLAPLGMQWAHPDWFKGDWTIANAPQPHWFFDVITWFGVETHTLIVLYLGYWLAALAAFGAATTILARAWAPRHTWAAIVLVSIAASVTPIDNLGSGTLWFATPLPNVLGGCLLLLTTSGLLTGRHRLAAIAGTVTALVHVQHGTVTTVLLLLMAVAVWRRQRAIDWYLVAGTLGSLAFTVLALRLRPIAGDLTDFADACHVIIPYHCEANSWARWYILGGTALVMLALLTYIYIDKQERFRWWIVVMLPAVGLLGGVAADKLDVPVLGVLAQGLNIYRLMLVLLPLTLWGFLAPVLADLSSRRRWLMLGVVLVLGLFALRLSWAVDKTGTVRSQLLILAFTGFLVLACVGLTVPDVTRRPERLRGVALAGLSVVILMSVVSGRTMELRPFDIRMFPQGETAAWGDEVQRVVPVGGELLTPPAAYELRMITKRAVVVDCKYGPYGGPAWVEYKARMALVGGFEQCLGARGAKTYADLSGDQLAAVAKRYGAQFIVVTSRTRPPSRNEIESRVPVTDSVTASQVLTSAGRGLVDRGWTIAVQATEDMPFFLLKAPTA